MQIDLVAKIRIEGPDDLPPSVLGEIFADLLSLKEDVGKTEEMEWEGKEYPLTLLSVSCEAEDAVTGEPIAFEAPDSAE